MDKEMKKWIFKTRKELREMKTEDLKVHANRAGYPYCQCGTCYCCLAKKEYDGREK